MLFHPTYKWKLLNISYLYLYLFWRYSHIKLLFTSLKFSFYVNLELLVGYFKNHSEFLDNIFRKCYLHKSFCFPKVSVLQNAIWKVSFLQNTIWNCFLTISSTVFTIVALIFLLLFLPLWPKNFKNLWNFYRQFFCFYWSILSKQRHSIWLLEKN